MLFLVCIWSNKFEANESMILAGLALFVFAKTNDNYANAVANDDDHFHF